MGRHRLFARSCLLRGHRPHHTVPQFEFLPNFYRFDPGTEEIYAIDGISESLRGGSSYTPDLFVDHYSNRPIISGEWKYAVGTDFEFYETFEQIEDMLIDGVTCSWTPVEGATGYRVMVNSEQYETATLTRASVTGYEGGMELAVDVEYTVDGLTYTATPYRQTLRYTVVLLFSYESAASGCSRPSHSGFWVDPYDPRELVHSAADQLVTYDVDADSQASFGGGVNVHIICRTCY